MFTASFGSVSSLCQGIIIIIIVIVIIIIIIVIVIVFAFMFAVTIVFVLALLILEMLEYVDHITRPEVTFSSKGVWTSRVKLLFLRITGRHDHSELV
jgi:cobalamin biosynthesis protein CobD/CbiB